MSNNILIGVLAIGGLLLFINSSDDKKKETLQKQEVAKAKGDSAKKAVAQNPTEQQVHERSAAIAEIRILVNQYKELVAWEEEHGSKLAKDLQFPQDVWSAILKLRTDLVQLGAGATNVLFRGIQNPEDQAFWGDFDKLMVGTTKLDERESSLRSQRTAPKHPPLPATTHLGDEIVTDTAMVDSFQQEPKGVSQLTGEQLRELLAMKFMTVREVRREVSFSINGGQKEGVDAPPATTTNRRGQAFIENGEPSDEDMQASRENAAGFAGNAPSSASAPLRIAGKPDQLAITYPAAADSPQNFDNAHGDVTDNRPPANDPERRPQKLLLPSIPEEDIAQSFNTTGAASNREETAVVKFSPGKTPGEMAADGHAAQMRINLEEYTEQLNRHLTKMRRHMEDTTFAAKTRQQVISAWEYLKRLVPEGLNEDLYKSVSYDVKNSGFSDAQVKMIRSTEYFKLWDNAVHGMHTEKEEYVRKRARPSGRVKSKAKRGRSEL